jgi:hypothetical protein
MQEDEKVASMVEGVPQQQGLKLSVLATEYRAGQTKLDASTPSGCRP